MSELKKITMNGHDYTFVCKTRVTRNGFAHDVELFIDDMRAEENTSTYLNRTWETFCYQTCMLGAINKAIDKHAGAIERRFRNVNNISRMTTEKARELVTEIDSNTFIKEMRELAEEVRNHVH